MNKSDSDKIREIFVRVAVPVGIFLGTGLFIGILKMKVPPSEEDLSSRFWVAAFALLGVAYLVYLGWRKSDILRPNENGFSAVMKIGFCFWIAWLVFLIFRPFE